MIDLHFVIYQLAADLRDALDDREHGIDGAVARGGIGDVLAVGIDQRNGGRGNAVCRSDDLQTFQLEQLIRVFQLGFDDGFQILIVDFLLLVAQRFELFKRFVEFVFVHAVAEFIEARFESVAAGMFAEHIAGVGPADIGGGHDFVGGFVLEHSILVNAGLVGEGVFADDGFVALHVQAGERADEAADRDEFFGVDAGGEGEGVLAGFDGHDDFFEGGVARALADAVDGAFDLPRSAAHGREGVRYGEAQIIVAVRRENDFVRAGHMLDQVTEHRFVLCRRCEADGVGAVDRRRARFNRGVDDFAPGNPVRFATRPRAKIRYRWCTHGRA